MGSSNAVRVTEPETFTLIQLGGRKTEIEKRKNF